MRVTDEMAERWLVWARNFGEVVAWRAGTGTSRRFRVRVSPGVTRDGMPVRPRQGIFDILGHTAEDVVPPEMLLTTREALVFAMGCAVVRAAAFAGVEHEWQAERMGAWTPEAREAFARWREEAREANRADLAREAAEREAERQRRMAAHRARRTPPRALGSPDPS